MSLKVIKWRAMSLLTGSKSNIWGEFTISLVFCQSACLSRINLYSSISTVFYSIDSSNSTLLYYIQSSNSTGFYSIRSFNSTVFYSIRSSNSTAL